MTKEEIYTRHLNQRVKVDSNKEIDHDHYLAIMEAMEEYAKWCDQTQIIIHLEGGVIQTVSSNQKIEYVVIDEDDQSYEPIIVNGPKREDNSFDDPSEFFDPKKYSIEFSKDSN